MQQIPSNTATAALRRISFTLVDATDLITPEDISVTGVKVTLSIAGGTPAASTNDIVKVNGTAGEYYIELTQSESNQSDKTVIRGWLTPSGCALTKIEVEVVSAIPSVNTTQIGGQTASAAGTVTFPGTLASTTNITAATGVVLSGVTHTGAVIPTVTTTGTATAVTTVNGLANGVITANSIASNAITSAKIATDAIGAAQVAADAVSEIQNGLATGTNLATVDTVVDAIKVVTDKFTFDGDDVNANVNKINEVVITGSGETGDGFGV